MCIFITCYVRSLKLIYMMKYIKGGPAQPKESKYGSTK